eukprot:gene8556-17647_t
MGGIPSNTQRDISPSEQLRRDRLLTLRESRCYRCIDRFLQLVLFHIRRFEGVKAIVQNPMALDSFVEFLSSHILDDDIDPIICSMSNYEKLEPMKLSKVLSALKDSLKHAFSDSLSNDQEESSSTQKLVQFCCEVLPKYLQSDFYDDWRAKETLRIAFSISQKELTECTLPELYCSPAALDSDSVCPSDPLCISTTAFIVPPIIEVAVQSCTTSVDSVPLPQVVQLNSEQIMHRQSSMISQALSSCEPMAVPRLLRSDGWLTAFITAAETLPIGITLSVVSKHRQGYPVVYVNKTFQDVCGYKREEVVGERFGFMQGADTQLRPEASDGVERITLALATATPTVVSLSSQRHGLPFSSVVGVKPIKDQWRTYRYVIGIHTETAKENKVAECVSFVNSLLELLPEVSHRSDG